MEKECSKCKEVKNLNEFYTKKDKHYSYCKKCSIARTKKWNADNKERRKETNKKWNANSFSKKRYRVLKEKYGITPEYYESLLNEQNSCCKICGIHQDKLTKKLAVDHCHLTGKIRGLLCHHCNLLLGYSKDSIEVLEKAVKYLTACPF